VSLRQLPILLLLLLSGLFAFHARHYFPYLCDDALVSLRYAERWAHGRGLTWTDAERSLGYSNFLWVVLLGISAKLGAGLVTTARMLGIAGVILAVFAVGLEPRGRGHSLPRVLVGGALVVATAPFAVASIAGIEHGLVAGLVALSLRLLERASRSSQQRDLVVAGIPLALIALLRADGLVIVAALIAGSACLPRPSLASLRRAIVAAAPALVCAAAELGFRRAYYGVWLPLPLRARFAETTATDGLAYVGRGYASSSMLVLLALAATVLSLRRADRFRLALPGALILAWTGYLVAAGGDRYPGFRELLPALVPLCFVVADEVSADWARIVGQRVLVLPVLALCVVLHTTQGVETAENRRAAADRSAIDGLALGELLRTAFGARRPLLAVENPGAVPFASELESVDVTLAGGKPVLRKSPDLVVWRSATGATKPESKAGSELAKAAEFRADYQWIRVEAPQASESGIVWVRRERGKLGVVRAADRIDLPGYLFSGQGSSAVAHLDARNELVSTLGWDAPGVLADVIVPKGRWRLDLVPADPSLVVDVQCGDASMQRIAPVAGRVFDTEGSMPVSIVVAPRFGGAPVGLRSAKLVLVPDSAPALRCVPIGTPLRVAGAWLASPAPRRVPASHPSNVTFGSAGLLIDLGERPDPKRLEVSLSLNTPYLAELRREGRTVWPATLDKKRRSANLGHFRLDIGRLPEGAGPFELFIRPERPDVSSSIGSINLE
jgi:hypothetical protein